MRPYLFSCPVPEHVRTPVIGVSIVSEETCTNVTNFIEVMASFGCFCVYYPPYLGQKEACTNVTNFIEVMAYFFCFCVYYPPYLGQREECDTALWGGFVCVGYLD